MLHPELFIPEAFEEHDDKACVVRQLAVVTEIPRQDLEAYFDSHVPDWREQAISAAHVLDFCVADERACYVVRHHRLVSSYVPEDRRHQRSVAFAVHDGHAYFYSSARAVAQLGVSPETAYPTERLVTDPHEHEAPDVAEWLPWACNFDEPGNYYARDMDVVRGQFLRQGLDPRVTLAGMTQISRLQHTTAEGSVVVRSWPEHADELMRFVLWANKLFDLGIAWYGQGMASTTWMVFRALLLRRHRRQLAPEQKALILQEQDGRCAMCGGICEADDREYDHVVPLHASRRQLFQLLRKGCHEEKSKLEPRCNKEPLASVFARSVYEAYVESPPLPPLVLDVHATQSAGAPLVELDVRRCRRNALLYCAHPIPLFSPLDSVRERDACVLGDLNYIEGPRHRANRPSEVLRLLPYTGPRWYPRVAAEYLLHRGLVTWGDIKFVIDATGSVAPRDLEEPLAALEEAWRAAGALHLTKDSVNAMLGLLGSPRKFSYRLRSDYRPQDGVAFKLSARYGDVEKNDYIFQTKMLTNQSHRPLCDVALFTEHTRVAQILYVLKQLGCPPRNVVSIRTDAVIFHCGRTLRPKVVDAAALRFDELHLLRRRYEPLAWALETPWNMAPIDGLEPAFKMGEGRPLRCASADVLATESLRVQRPPPFQDVDPDTARELPSEDTGSSSKASRARGKRIL